MNPRFAASMAPHEGIPIAGVHDRAGNGLTALAALHELCKGITVAKLQVRGLDDVIGKACCGRFDRYLARHEFLARLVDAAAVEDDEIALRLVSHAPSPLP